MSHAQHDHHGHKNHPTRPPGIRKHTVLIGIGVVLMIAAMVIYVMSQDEALQPGQPVQNSTPAIAP